MLGQSGVGFIGIGSPIRSWPNQTTKDQII